MASEETSQWPLTAAATQTLLALPPSSAPKGAKPPKPKDAVKLALKELILRGAFRIQLEKRRMRKDKVILLPGDASGLPESLAFFDLYLRRYTPNEISMVVKGACQVNTTLIRDIGASFLEQLVEKGLAEPVKDKVLGLFPRTRWRRTATGDAWAASATEHVARLEALPGEAESNPETAATAVAAAGALVVMVPAALAAVARLRRKLSRHGGHVHVAYGGDDDFDVFDGVGDMFDSAFEGDLDAGVDSIDSALDSVADSIDSGVDAGVDSGGGTGDDGGGGGGDGGGGGNGGGS